MCRARRHHTSCTYTLIINTNLFLLASMTTMTNHYSAVRFPRRFELGWLLSSGEKWAASPVLFLSTSLYLFSQWWWYRKTAQENQSVSCEWFKRESKLYRLCISRLASIKNIARFPPRWSQCSSNSPDLPNRKVSTNSSRDHFTEAISVNSHRTHHAQCCSKWGISWSDHATNQLASLNRGPRKILAHKGTQPRLHNATPITLQSPLTLVCEASIELTFMYDSQSSTSSTRSFSAAALWEDKCADAMSGHVSYPEHVPSTYHDTLQRLVTFHGTLTQD